MGVVCRDDAFCDRRSSVKRHPDKSTVGDKTTAGVSLLGKVGFIQRCRFVDCKRSLGDRVDGEGC